jgi:predicted DNA-binding protein (UPF0251 family)
MANQKKDDTDWKERLKEIQKQMPKNKIVVKEENVDLPEPYQGTEKEEKPEVQPPKNQLIQVPTQVDFAYDAGKAEEDIDVDDPAYVLVQKIRDGEIDHAELTADDKFVAIRYLLHVEHLTQDQVAGELGISRRTVVNYVRKIKDQQAKALSQETVWTLGGEVWNLCMKAAYQALASNKPKQVAEVLEKMIQTLQTMGLVYRVPNQSQIQQATHQNISVSGASQFKSAIEGEGQEVNIENVLTDLMKLAESGNMKDEGHNNNS